MTKALKLWADSITKRLKTKAAYENVFGPHASPDAEAVLKHLCTICNLNKTIMVKGAVDPVRLGFEEGKRWVVLTILRNANRDVQETTTTNYEEQNEP